MYQLFIKNMVCPRCNAAVKQVLQQLGYEVVNIKLGEAEIDRKPDFDILNAALKKQGFELLEDKKSQLITQIKTAIISFVHYPQKANQRNLSDWLAEELKTDFTSLSQLFSGHESITIEKFYILQRIEKVKELLTYNELALKEIAYQLGFSSVAHLSAQFKKETGLTITQFKENKQARRKTLDSI